MKLCAHIVACIVLACPALAMASPVNDREWMRPITPRAIPYPISVTAHGPVYTVPYGEGDLRGAQYLGPARLSILSLNVAMQMRDEAGLQRYALLVSNPHSLYYRHFLTPQQIADAFGASEADYNSAIQYFWNQGLAVRWWNQREMIGVVGPQQAMERAFGTHFGLYKKNGIIFWAPTAAPRFAMPLPVRGIGGMVTYRHFRRHLDIGGPFSPLQGFGPGTLSGNSPFDIAAAFDYTSAYHTSGSCCKGDGITIGIIGTGPISAFDVPAYRLLYNLTSATGTVHQVNVTAPMVCCYSTGLKPPPPVTAPGCGGPLTVCNPEDTEAQLDTEQTSSLAPNSTVNFYLAYNPTECFAPGPPTCASPQEALGIAESDDELQQIASDNVADVVSGSYGIGELDFASPSNPILTCPAATPSGCSGGDPTIFATLAAQGIAVFFSSGDSGAAGCQRDFGSPYVDKLCVSYPSDDWNVVSVGGTSTPIGSNGQLTGLLTAWGVLTQTGGAGGGGFSVTINRPPFERQASFCTSNGARCDSMHRIQPDLALNADPATGVGIIINCGSAPPGCAGLGGVLQGSIGGTSASAPAMAAMWALVLEACKQTPACASHGGAHPYRLGNPAPLLFALNPAQKSSSFLDVTVGNNAVPLSTSGGSYAHLTPGFNATAGFDLTTGLGAPFARNLIKAVVGI